MIPTLQQLISEIEGDFRARFQGLNALLRKTVLGRISKVLAGALHLFYLWADALIQSLMPWSPNSITLPFWAAAIGLSKTIDEKAVYTVTLTGEDGAEISTTDAIQHESGLVFYPTTLATIVGGEVVVNIEAENSGTDYNFDVGTALTLVSPIDGIDGNTEIDAIVTIGVDLESNESFYARYVEAQSSISTGGNDLDYVRWAKEISGITRVWIFPLMNGDGTVGVMIAADDEDGNIVPTAGKIAEVLAHLASKAPLDAKEIDVFPATPKPLDPIIDLEPNTAEVQASVDAVGRAYLRIVGGPSGTLKLSNITEIISSADGETSHVLIFPDEDFITSPTEVPVWGTPTYQ